MDHSSFHAIAVDVGRVKDNYGWAAVAVDTGRPPVLIGHGQTPEGTAQAVIAALDVGRPTAVGWEAPGVLPVPMRGDWERLGRARAIDGNRSWSAFAGATITGLGIVQATWRCRAVAGARGRVRCTCDPQRWEQHGGLLLWEAFVSGSGKPRSMPDDLGLDTRHEVDAAAAAHAFVDLVAQNGLRLDPAHIAADSCGAINLLAAAALASGLDIDPAEVARPLVIVKTPAPRAP
jgi:hypothetical protein